MKDYEVIEHTADIGIRVRAKDLSELFKNAALAMFDIIAELPQQPGSPIQQQISIKQASQNLEELLVFWLNELLSLSSTKELIFFDFKITKLKDNALQALTFGRPAGECKINVEIKAATYHGLMVRQQAGFWEAEVIFDV